jgi:hypothetical protein
MPKFCKYSSCGKRLTQGKNELTLAFNKRDTCNKRCSTLHSNEKKTKPRRVHRIPLQSSEETHARNSVSE